MDQFKLLLVAARQGFFALCDFQKDPGFRGFQVGYFKLSVVYSNRGVYE
jgi:hypothetical protein